MGARGRGRVGEYTHVPLKEAPKKHSVIGMAIGHLTNAANAEVED